MMATTTLNMEEMTDRVMGLCIYMAHKNDEDIDNILGSNIILTEEQYAEVMNMIEQLPSKQAYIIKRLYGLGGMEKCRSEKELAGEVRLNSDTIEKAHRDLEKIAGYPLFFLLMSEKDQELYQIRKLEQDLNSCHALNPTDQRVRKALEKANDLTHSDDEDIATRAKIAVGQYFSRWYIPVTDLLEDEDEDDKAAIKLLQQDGAYNILDVETFTAEQWKNMSQNKDAMRRVGSMLEARGFYNVFWDFDFYC